MFIRKNSQTVRREEIYKLMGDIVREKGKKKEKVYIERVQN